MEITVVRYSSQEESTLGLMLINGTFVCYTLEDEARAIKVMGETRIPAGRYEVKLRNEGTKTERYLEKFGAEFHKGMLHVTNVPNFQYILIHIGNDDDDTAGCLLVGNTSQVNINHDGFIGDSTAAYKRIYPMVANVLELGEKVYITYLDQIPSPPASESSVAAEVTTPQLNFRQSPGGKRQGVLFENTDLDILDQRNGWCKVNVEGWVSDKYVK